MNLLIAVAAKYLYLIVILAFLAWTYFRAKKQMKNIVKLVVISFPISFVIAKILSHFYYNARPFVTENIKPLIFHAPNNGFPSDHTLLTMTIAAVIYQYNKKVGTILALLALCVGYARVAAKIHHQIDVWAAAVVAVFAVYLAIRILMKLGVEIAK